MSHTKPKDPTPEEVERGFRETMEDIRGKTIPQLHCLKCQFDVLAPADEDSKAKNSGIQRMKRHTKKGNHPWGFQPDEEVTS